MPKVKRATFEAAGPFVARVAFPFDGETFFAGDVFPHGMVSFRKLRQLYDCRRINFADDPTTPNTKKDVFDWRTLDEKGLFAYAFEQTGTHFRKIERAIHALDDACPLPT